MIRKYFIDGNNLIGKSKFLKGIQSKNPQESREKLVFKLERFFTPKGYEVVLYLDGYPKEAIRTGKVKIVYSYNRTADDCIRDEIERDKSPKTIAVVSSDHYVMNAAKANACTVFKSEEFLTSMDKSFSTDEEAEIQKNISEEEIKRLFDVDEE